MSSQLDHWYIYSSINVSSGQNRWGKYRSNLNCLDIFDVARRLA